MLLNQLHCRELVENSHRRSGKQRFTDPMPWKPFLFEEDHFPAEARQEAGCARTSGAAAYHHCIVFSLRRAYHRPPFPGETSISVDRSSVPGESEGSRWMRSLSSKGKARTAATSRGIGPHRVPLRLHDPPHETPETLGAFLDSASIYPRVSKGPP